MRLSTRLKPVRAASAPASSILAGPREQGRAFHQSTHRGTVMGSFDQVTFPVSWHQPSTLRPRLGYVFSRIQPLRLSSRQIVDTGRPNPTAIAAGLTPNSSRIWSTTRSSILTDHRLFSCNILLPRKLHLVFERALARARPNCGNCHTCRRYCYWPCRHSDIYLGH